MRDAGRLIEERGEYRFYKYIIDAIFSNARGGGDGVGLTKTGKGLKLMVMVDARALPVMVDCALVTPHECKPVQGLLEFMLSKDCRIS